jgi:IS5 family transposase
LSHGILLSRPKLGHPKSDLELFAEEKRQLLDDQRQCHSVESKIGQGKRLLGLDLIGEKLAVTQGSTIAFNVLVMNLEKLQELLSASFTAFLRVILVNEGPRSIRTVLIKVQISAA